MEKKNFVEFVNANAKIIKSAACNVVTSKELRVKKDCPFNSIVKQTHFVGFGIGFDYQTFVEGAQKRSGATSDYQLTEMWHRVYNKWFNCHKSDETKLYLRLMASHPQLEKFGKCHNVWIADGREVSYEDVEPWLYASDKPKSQDYSKQVANGVSEEKVVRYQLVSVENITYFKQGNLEWTK